MKWKYHRDEKETAEDDNRQEDAGDIPARQIWPIHFEARLSCTIPAHTASAGDMNGGAPKTTKNRQLSLPSIEDDLAVTVMGLQPPVRRRQANGARSRLSVFVKREPCKGKEPDKCEAVAKFIVHVRDICF